MKILKCPLFLIVFAGLVFLTGCTSKTEQTKSLPRLEKVGSATRLIIDDKPFLMLGGELHNSTMGGAAYMRPIWKLMSDHGLNTVVATASWELVEPVEGQYDFALVDSMIFGARKEELKLVVIWFATWKNGRSTYPPAWVKKDQTRFPLVKDETGKTLNIITTLSTEARDADARAFAALMKHIKEVDEDYKTVVMMQVENEIGVLGGNIQARRDFSDIANTAFNGPVPAELMQYLEANKATIHPGVREAWEKQGFKMTGTWEEVFGKGVLLPDWKDMSYLTEELFMTWNYAKYVGYVAAAGKAEYNLPMYVNAWLKQPGVNGHAPGNYPSGGPTPQMIDVWRAGAPSIDFIAPDIYATDYYRYVLDTYTQSGNPLFIPETRMGAAAAARAFFTFGNYNCLLFAPFGLDGREGGEVATLADLAHLKDAYSKLEALTPLIIENQGTENIKGLYVETKDPTDSVSIGGFTVIGNLGRRTGGAELAGFDIYGSPIAAPVTNEVGGAVVICTAPGEYILSGKNMRISFAPGDANTVQNTGLLYIEEGTVDGTTWIPIRRLNGDEFNISFDANKSKTYKVGVYHY